MKHKRHILLFLFIVLLGIVIRFYRMGDLAVFLADQASDSTVVLNLLHGKLTLLGPISSVGGFFNGPVVYYLMLPFYLVLNGHPIAGTLFQTTLSIATIPLVYLLGRSVKNTQVGLIAAFLFAISPLMIDYSRAAFNSYPAVFFSTLIMYFFVNLKDHFSVLKIMIIGLLIGFIVQMHYLAVSFLIFSLLYPVFIHRKLVTLKYYSLLLLGIIAGLLPFLLFELRHQFLNINLILKYFFSAKETGKSIMSIFQIWPEITSKLLLGNSYILGITGFLITSFVAVFVFVRNKTEQKQLAPYFFLFLIVFTAGMIYGGKMQTHYVIIFHTSLIVLFSLTIWHVLKGNENYLILFSLIVLFINGQNWNLEKKIHPLQDGLSIADFKQTAEIIKNDKKNKFNIAMHAQGDNRAMPLRYFLTLLNDKPMPYENYSEAENLYFLIRKNEELSKIKMWEYTSFGDSKILKHWIINKDYLLYKLGKRTQTTLQP